VDLLLFHQVCIRFACLHKKVFFFFSTGFIVVSFHNLTQKKTLITLPKGPTIYKTLICAVDFLIVVTFTKKLALRIFCATN